REDGARGVRRALRPARRSLRRRGRAAALLRPPLRGHPARGGNPDGGPLLAGPQGRRDLRASLMGAVNAVKDVVNFLTNPPIFISLVALVFFLVIGRRGFWRPRVGLVVGAVAAAFVALSTFDPNFRLIVGKPDNIPIV